MTAPRVALVTGAGRGIGRAIAVRLAREGHALALMGRTASTLEQTAAVVRQLGAKTVIAVADVAVEKSVVEGLRSVEQTLGAVDILVNNAGVIDSSPLVATSSESFQRLLDINLFGPFVLMREALKGMQERRWGRVINIASAGARLGFQFAAAYCASKHGLIGLTRVAALESAASGVTVNAICPGFTETNMLSESAEKIRATTGMTAEAARAMLANASPLGRIITPLEVANAVAMLASDQASAINGQTLGVDGGQVM
ncbi:MAG: SDR family NAD(P)-dependent oxidoreductase [Myxococcaceae bacterium]